MAKIWKSRRLFLTTGFQSDGLLVCWPSLRLLLMTSPGLGSQLEWQQSAAVSAAVVVVRVSVAADV